MDHDGAQSTVQGRAVRYVWSRPDAAVESNFELSAVDGAVMVTCRARNALGNECGISFPIRKMERHLHDFHRVLRWRHECIVCFKTEGAPRAVFHDSSKLLEHVKANAATHDYVHVKNRTRWARSWLASQGLDAEQLAKAEQSATFEGLQEWLVQHKGAGSSVASLQPECFAQRIKDAKKEGQRGFKCLAPGGACGAPLHALPRGARSTAWSMPLTRAHTFANTLRQSLHQTLPCTLGQTLRRTLPHTLRHSFCDTPRHT